MSSENQQLDIRYIIISKEHNSMLSSMIDFGLLGKKEDGLKLGISLALAFNPDGQLSTEEYSKLSRQNNGALNLSSADIDEDESITGTISVLTSDLTRNNYRRMMELAYLGLEILSKKYFDENTGMIDWSSIQNDLK